MSFKNTKGDTSNVKPAHSAYQTITAKNYPILSNLDKSESITFAKDIKACSPFSGISFTINHRLFAQWVYLVNLSSI